MPIRLRYVGVDGRERELVYLGPGMPLTGAVEAPAEPTSRWQLENGSVIQIPDDCWTELGIAKYYEYEIDEDEVDDMPN